MENHLLLWSSLPFSTSWQGDENLSWRHLRPWNRAKAWIMFIEWAQEAWGYLSKDEQQSPTLALARQHMQDLPNLMGVHGHSIWNRLLFSDHLLSLLYCFFFLRSIYYLKLYYSCNAFIVCCLSFPLECKLHKGKDFVFVTPVPNACHIVDA